MWNIISYILHFSIIRRYGHDRPAMIAYLYGPMLAMIIANMVIVWSAVVFRKASVKVSSVTSTAHVNQK